MATNNSRPRAAEVEIACANPTCGFRAHADYFEDKPRFYPSVCPRVDCGGATVVVHRGTNNPVAGARMALPFNPDGDRPGAVIIP